MRLIDKDTIYRQDAVEALKNAEPLVRDFGYYKVIETIRLLPSAESEIVRCKDCKWGREVCGNIECFVDSNIPPEYHGYEWFCPNGER